MNKTELVAVVAESAGISKKAAADAVNATFDAIGDALVKGDNVQLIGFGTFLTRDRKERVAKNPRTGEKVSVPAAKVPAFKAGKGLKDKVNA